MISNKDYKMEKVCIKYDKDYKMEKMCIEYGCIAQVLKKCNRNYVYPLKTFPSFCLSIALQEIQHHLFKVFTKTSWYLQKL